MAPVPLGPSMDPEIRDALAMLARGLAGALEVSALPDLPRATLPTGSTTGSTAGSTAGSTTAMANLPTEATTTPTSAQAAAPAAARIATTASAITTAHLPPPAAVGIGAQATLRQPTRAERLRVLAQDELGDCTRCKLHRGRNKIVFGAGNSDAAVVFVGDGPGAEEDRTGMPFVGAAGQLLNRMIEAMGMTRDDVYICNVVKCRPPNNRDPEADEVEACESFLKEQLAIIRPRVIVGLGRHACHTLLRTQVPLSRLRGRWTRYEDIDFMPTYHPSFLLREDRDPTKARKREAWSDLQLVMARLGLSRS